MNASPWGASWSRHQGRNVDQVTSDALDKLVADWPALSDTVKGKLACLLGAGGEGDEILHPQSTPAPPDRGESDGHHGIDDSTLA